MSLCRTALAILDGSFVELTGPGAWEILCSNLEILLS